MKKRVLIVEDEEDIIELLKYNLEKEGYTTYAYKNGKKGLDAIRLHKPDLVILDLMLPGIAGLEIARKIRRDETISHIPIIMLTAKSEESDVIVGLEMGADDYITKPFSPKVLISRARAVLRRYEAHSGKEKKLMIGSLMIDAEGYKAMLSGKEIPLTLTEFKLLERMSRKPGVVFSRDKLLDEVFGYDSASYDRTIDAHIKSLRKKLGRYRNYIATVRGVGYKFREYPACEE